MKHILFSLNLVFSSLLSISQIDILWDDDPGVIYNGQTINIVKDYAGFDVYMHCQNTGSTAQDIKFRRVVLSTNDTLFNDQFCDNNLCYSCFGSDWTTPAPNPLQPGDSCIMKGTFYFYDGGTVLIRYYILDINDNPLDSVDVNIVNTVDISEAKNGSILAYPNPSTDFLNIEISNVSNNNLLFLYDISGKKVLSTKLSSSMNIIDLRHLKSGIYSYQISNGNQLLKSDKLILKK